VRTQNSALQLLINVLSGATSKRFWNTGRDSHMDMISCWDSYTVLCKKWLLSESVAWFLKHVPNFACLLKKRCSNMFQIAVHECDQSGECIELMFSQEQLPNVSDNTKLDSHIDKFRVEPPQLCTKWLLKALHDSWSVFQNLHACWKSLLKHVPKRCLCSEKYLLNHVIELRVRILPNWIGGPIYWTTSTDLRMWHCIGH